MIKEKHVRAINRGLIVKGARDWFIKRHGRQAYEDLNRTAKSYGQRRGSH